MNKFECRGTHFTSEDRANVQQRLEIVGRWQ